MSDKKNILAKINKTPIKDTFRWGGLFNNVTGLLGEKFGEHPLLFSAIIFLSVRVFLLLFNAGYAWDTMGEERIFSTWAIERMRANEAVGQGLFNEFLYGGAWVQSYLYIPVFKILGCSHLAMKIVPLLFTFAGFMAYLLIAFYFYGKRAAYLFTLLCTCGTPMFVQYQLLGMGNHSEMIAFTGPGFLFLYWMLFGKKPSILIALAASFLIGLWMGLGIFYCFSVMPFVFLFAVGIVLVIIRNLVRSIVLAVAVPVCCHAGFSLGYQAIGYVQSITAHPYFGYYVNRKLPLDVAFKYKDSLGSVISPERVWEFITVVAPRSFSYRNPIPDYVYYCIALVAFFTFFWFVFLSIITFIKSKKHIIRNGGMLFRPETLGTFLLLSYIGGFLISLVGHHGVIWKDSMWDSPLLMYEGYHYFLPLLPTLFLFIAVSVRWLFHWRRGWERLGKTLVLLVALLGFVSLVEVSGPFGGILGRSCVDYFEFTSSNIFAYRVQYLEPELFCNKVRVHALTTDPEFARDTCRAIEDMENCSCPFELPEKKPPPLQDQ